MGFSLILIPVRPNFNNPLYIVLKGIFLSLIMLWIENVIYNKYI